MLFKEKENNRHSFKKIVAISAGGTGGHIFPALSVAKTLIEDGYYVLFFTDKKFNNYIKSDNFLLNCGQFEIVKLCCKNAKRWKQIFMIIIDFFKCFKILKRRVKICIGFGGFCSFTPMLFGILTFRKTIIHEQNAVIGLANRILLPFVKVCLLSFETTKKINKIFLKKCFFVGNPIRDEIKALVYNYDNPSVNYRAFYKIDDIINLTIIGGSQATMFFDEILPEAVSLLPNHITTKLFVRHQCREENIDKLNDFYTKQNIAHEVKKFFFNIAGVMRNSHLVVSRAGSTTIAELSALGVPSILVPLPNATNNHQFENAKFLRDKNGIILIEQQNITPERLCRMIENLFNNDYNLAELSFSIRQQSQIYADKKILAIMNKMLKINENIHVNSGFKAQYINDNVGLG